MSYTCVGMVVGLSTLGHGPSVASPYLDNGLKHLNLSSGLILFIVFILDSILFSKSLMENGSGGSIAIKVKLKHFVVQD